MKQFSCNCIGEQFKNPEQVFVGFSDQSNATILCAYRPNQKITLRNIKLEANYCPYCGEKLKDI